MYETGKGTWAELVRKVFKFRCREFRRWLKTKIAQLANPNAEQKGTVRLKVCHKLAAFHLTVYQNVGLCLSVCQTVPSDPWTLFSLKGNCRSTTATPSTTLHVFITLPLVRVGLVL